MLTDEIPNKYSIDCVTLNAPDTSDHEFVTDVDTIGIKEKKQHICSCGKEFGHRQSLHRHRKNCNSVTKSSDNSTDLKRQTVYVKQGDTWMKDIQDKTELKKIVETVKCRNYSSLRLWEREHPEAFECDTPDNIDYMRISSESLGGFSSTNAIKMEKIINYVVKEVYVK